MKLHTTEYLSCPRASWYKAGGYKGIGHIMNVKGKICHSLFAYTLTKWQYVNEREIINLCKAMLEDSNIPTSEYQYVREQLVESCPVIYTNFKDWLYHTKLPLFHTPLTIEKRMERNLHGFTQILTPDAYNDDILLDFKTGHSFQPKWINQVSDYYYAIRKKGKDRKVYIIMVNEDGWREYFIPKAKIEKAFQDNQSRARKFHHLFSLRACEFSLLCCCCSYRHICSG